MKKFLVLLSGLRRLAGDEDYARYCEHFRTRHPEKALPTAKEFYLSRLNEKYARPSRCC